MRRGWSSRAASGRAPTPAVTLVRTDPAATVRRLKQQDGAGIYLAGGGDLAGQLLDEIDELVVRVYPVVASTGTPMFSSGSGPRHLTFSSSFALKSGGVVVQTYVRA